ncbi:MAG: DEAD/DEAH box helicase [Myxococcales bacterium]|nr:DEAD/DEAH box helicase [Myxococcales bacterium]
MTTAPPPPDAAASAFAALGIEAPILSSLAALGYEEPTPIQKEAIPPLLVGRDLLGQAATGTGKTAAFALPLLQRCHRAIAAGEKKRVRDPSALVLVPTRELAMQVAEAVHRYGKGLGLSVLPVYGGAAMQQQLMALKRGVDVVVATPGRALDHLRRGTLRLGGLHLVILDEADEMLDMGFAEDLEALLAAAPAERQTALFSATLPPRISAIAGRHLRDPVTIHIAREKVTAGKVPRVRQTAFIVPRAHKLATLGRVLDMESPTSALVFCRTRTEVDELAETLNARGYRAEALHGGLSQEQRDRVMKKFRGGKAELLIATDVAARGLDIEHLSHVVNYDVPSEPEAYIHRIGRTGRAGREGVAITLAEPREHRMLRNIESLTKQKIDLATVPTVADLRARRLDLLRGSLRETILEGGLDTVRVVVESLAGEFDLMDVAAAAVKMAQAASDPGERDEQEIPAYIPRERPPAAPVARGVPVGKPVRGAPAPGGAPPARGAAPSVSKTGARFCRVFIGAGRQAKIRPGDLVGAIANEAGVDARAIGAIQIGDSFSLVEVLEEEADKIIAALRATTVKGRRVTVRRER